MDDLGIISLKFMAVGALLLANGFFTAAGFALVKVRSTQVELLAKRGLWRARMAHHVLGHLDAYLSATQLGNVMTSLGLGWMGEGFLTPLVRNLVHGLNLPDAIVHTAGFLIPFGFVTALNIIFGELAPKSLAIQRPQATVLWTVAPLRVFFAIFQPVVRLLNGTAALMLRLMGLQQLGETDHAHSEDELRILLSRSRDREVSALARRLALRAFDLRRRIARQIMLPRRQIVFLDVKRTLEQNLTTARESKHTRFPLCDGGLDQILGMVHMKDLLWVSQQTDGGVDLMKIKRDVLVVPETTGLERLLSTFQRAHQHLAIVVDEYGSTVGMVTIEDVIEELVGEIQDEFDQEVPLIQDLGNGEFLAEGIVPLQQFNAVAGADFHSDDVDTLSGYLVEQLGRLPTENETFTIGKYRVTVKKMGRRRIHQAHIKRLEQETAPS